jgi:hypothetical protein
LLKITQTAVKPPLLDTSPVPLVRASALRDT